MDEDSKVVGYLCGHNESNVLCCILDGMYAMECQKKRWGAKESKETLAMANALGNSKPKTELFANSVDFGSAHPPQKYIEYTQNVHAICIIQLSEQSPSSDFIYTSDHLSEPNGFVGTIFCQRLTLFCLRKINQGCSPQKRKLFTNSVDLDPLTRRSII